jgi:hypothetical protein
MDTDSIADLDVVLDNRQSSDAHIIADAVALPYVDFVARDKAFPDDIASIDYRV